MAPRRQARAERGRAGRPRECTTSVTPSIYRRELREAARQSGRWNRLAKGKQHACTLYRRMPMRLSALCIEDGTNTFGGLPLQRMPAPIRQRLRHVHAGEERQPDSDRPDEASYAYRRQWERGYGGVLSRVRSPPLPVD